MTSLQYTLVQKITALKLRDMEIPIITHINILVIED